MRYEEWRHTTDVTSCGMSETISRMRWQAWVSLAGTEVSLLFALALVRRWHRSRRPYLLSWSVALTSITVGLGAVWYGQALGFTEPVMRTYYLAGGLLAAPWLGLGEVELLLRREVAQVARLALLGFSVAAGYIVAFDPLRGPVSGAEIPDGTPLFQSLPLALIAVSNLAGTAAVLGGIALSGWRARRGGPAARARFAGTLVIGVGVLLFAGAGTAARLGLPGLQPVVLSAAVAVMYAGFGQTGRRVGRHRTSRPSRLGRRAPDRPAAGPAPALR